MDLWFWWVGWLSALKCQLQWSPLDVISFPHTQTQSVRPTNVHLSHPPIHPIDRSTCGLCGAKIDKGVLRFEYVLKASTSLRDTRYIHSSCLENAPLDCREHDFNKIRSFLAVPGVDSIACEVFERLETLLNPHPASGSGGA